MDIVYEIIGYAGTALVLTSMMMTSVVKLRIINAAGSLASLIYAIAIGSWPVVFLNASLLVINIAQLIRLNRVKVTFNHKQIGAQEMALQHFLSCYEKDIRIYFPDFEPTIPPHAQVHVVYREAAPVGVLIGIRNEEQLEVILDYATPQYRDCSIAAYLFQRLKELGVKTVIAESETKAHITYLHKMGFVGDGKVKIKTL